MFDNSFEERNKLEEENEELHAKMQHLEHYLFKVHQEYASLKQETDDLVEENKYLTFQLKYLYVPNFFFKLFQKIWK